ncbi:SPL family radical SAM protein [Tautonia rosea]|uniref:SPL family radical SAM protein n=1 Tax=Tautonia rosea TaxID=2728037 RepID=UPI001472EEE7|nr:radical SAM protein [Tautonia rosea]
MELAIAEPEQGMLTGRSVLTVRYVRRRGPLLRPARGGVRESGLYGIDLTAGCAMGCAFCFVKGTMRDPGPGRLLFDPRVVKAIGPAIEALDVPPKRVVLSPSSDPLPPIREVRSATLRIIEQLLERGIEVVVMTRGRVTRDLARLLGSAPDRVRVAVGVTTLGRSLSRALEPSAPLGTRRLKGMECLIEAGIPVEARLEPLIPGLTDTRENLRPLLRELGRIGVREAMVHYAFLQPAVIPTLREALTPFGYTERLVDLYEGGPVFSVGEAGATKHVPLDARREGLARVIAWGAEAGLIVSTGSAQNPDLPKIEAVSPKAEAPLPTLRSSQAKEVSREAAAVSCETSD